MPAPLQLAGQRFGRLTVIAKVANRSGYWRCRCDCGREENIHRRQLTEPSRPTGQRGECIVCMRGPCVVCGGPIELPGTRMMNTCCDDCKTIKKRGLFRQHYYRLVERDPDHNKKVWQERAQKMKQDPDYAARMRAYWAAQYAKKRDDPDYLEREREYGKAHYWENRDAILARRAARMAALSDEERAALEQERREKSRAHYRMNRDVILAKRKARWAALSDEQRARQEEIRRRQGREWRRKWRAELKRDPERKAAYLAWAREWQRESALRRMMARAFDMMTELERSDHDGNDDDQ